MHSKVRILFCGGGSVGHLAPSIAILDAVKERVKDAEGLFVCSIKKDDRKFLRSQGVRSVPLVAPRTNTLLRLFLFPFLFLLGSIEAFFIILFFRPTVIFAKGGYVSVPICVVGWFLFRPIVLHESDRMMGRANTALLRFARHLCIGAPQKELANVDVLTRRRLHVHATGNPIRKKLLRGTRDGGIRVTKFSGKRPVLLVMGGSQGAQALNEAVWGNLEALVTLADIIHITGRGKLRQDMTHGRYMQREVLTEELEHIYALADVVVSRAGAGAIAELSATKKATILVPLPDDVQKHQGENARFLKQANAVIVLDQATLKSTLPKTVQDLLHDDGKRTELGKRLHAFADPDAAERISNILIAVSRKEA